jgi:hypothetical protein
MRRPVEAITPLIPIGKEIERRSQEGEDISVLDNAGPIKYHPRKTANTRPADAALILRAGRFSKKLLRRESGASQHAIDRFFRGERIHPGTRTKLAQAVEQLERRGQCVYGGTSEEAKLSHAGLVGYALAISVGVANRRVFPPYACELRSSASVAIAWCRAMYPQEPRRSCSTENTFNLTGGAKFRLTYSNLIYTLNT